MRFPAHVARDLALVVTILAPFWAPCAFAHDFWIEPQTFRPSVGAPLSLRLFVGQDLQGDSVPRNDRLIERFVVVEAGKDLTVGGDDGDDPAGTVVLGKPGVHLVGYRSRPSPIELEASKFETYLAEEGLESIIAARAKRGASAAPGKEIYSRCAKALVEAGAGGPSAGHDRPLGFTLELIPRKDPRSPSSKAPIPVQVLFRGAPLPGALVVAMNREHPEAKQSARSDRKGAVTFRLDRPGLWLVKAVHMEAAPEGSGADWESFWASLTFEVPERP